MARKSIRFRTKMIILYWIACSITIVTIGSMFFYFASHNIRENMITANEHIVKQMNSNVAAMQNGVYDISLMILQNPYNYKDDAGFYYITRSQSLLSLIAISRKENGSFTGYYERGFGFVPYDEFEQTDLYREIISAAGRPVWFMETKDNPQILRQLPSEKIVMARTMVNDRNAFQSDDILFLGVSTPIVGELCNADSLPDAQRVLVTDADFQLIYQSEEGLIDSFEFEKRSDEHFFEYNCDDNTYFISAANENPYNWRVFLITEDRGLFADGEAMVMVIGAVVMGLVIVSTFALIMFFSNTLTRPIKKLIESVDELGVGSLDHHVEIVSNDEIGELGMHYNSMLDNLRALVDENYILALREREAELSVLQTQINPHFLYNTLTTFYMKSFAAGQHELAGLVLALSKMFRTSLSKGSAWIPVSSEKEFLENYLLLQKQQFGERLEYRIDFDAVMLMYQIPKLMLQPFVENALLHGLGESAEGGKIEVCGRLRGDRLSFCVKDDGGGMDAETLEQIRNLPDDKPTKGYALWNIRERLKLYFQGEYILEYDSELGKGVCVYIEVPAKRGDGVKRNG